MTAVPEPGCSRGSTLQLDEKRPGESFPGSDAGALVVRRVNELSRHPAHARLGLAVSSAQLSAIGELGDHAFKDPLLITRDGVIIDGYARWELATKQEVSTLLCVELDVDEEEALRRMLKRHRRLSGWNDYNRICMASQLKDVVRRRARANQEAGGRFKGSSKLTEVNVRKEIAHLADVSEGNVTKVDQIENAHSEVSKALCRGEIRIHRAWLWRKMTPEQQQEQLRLYRMRGLKRKATTLISKHRIETHEAPNRTSITIAGLGQIAERLSAMSSREPKESDPILIGSIEGPGKAIFLTKELYQAVSAQWSAR